MAGGLSLVVLILAILVFTKKPSTPDGTIASGPATATAAPAVEPAKPVPAPVTAAPVVTAAAAPDTTTTTAPAADAKPDAKILSPTPSASQVPAAAPPPKDAPKADPKADPAKKGPDAAKADAKAADQKVASTAPPATLVFAIQPWGEIFVDGKSRGVTPPMKTLKLPPGKYKLEVRNTTFPAHSENLDLKTRDEITVRHRFQ